MAVKDDLFSGLRGKHYFDPTKSGRYYIIKKVEKARGTAYFIVDVYSLPKTIEKRNERRNIVDCLDNKPMPFAPLDSLVLSH